jgi:DNA/RNA-binding domain of Phe-tRNA-synthetase-like protein
MANARPTLALDPGLGPPVVRAALVWAHDLATLEPMAGERAFVVELLARVRAAGEGFLAADRKAAVRAMLRHGRYRPSGRSKPSSEYLLAAALDGTFPSVNGPVDVNNAVSLESGYPASIFDAAATGATLLLRRGRPGECYVFNPSGQTIDLEDLVCVCRPEGGVWVPCGNPVKDSMSTKVSRATRDVAAVIYAPTAESAGPLESAAARFAELLCTECGAAGCGWALA